MVTKAKRESNNRWDRENMTILACKVRKDVADQAKEAAQLAGTTINAVLRQAIDNLIAEKACNPGISFTSPELGKAVQAASSAAGMTVQEWVEDLIQRELFG